MSLPHHPQAGVAFVISAPSGGGKTTLCRRLVDTVERMSFSVSHTTRAPRAHERDGVDYHFVDTARFEAMVAKDQFVEWARVHNKLYGTSREEVARLEAKGHDVLFEIDVQGGRQILAALPHVALIFLVPPSMQVLAGRLRERASDDPEEIERRLGAAVDEVQQAAFYTHWIVNDDLDAAASQLRSIVVAERLRCANKVKLRDRLLGRPSGL